MDVRSIFNKKLGFGAMRLPGATEGNIDHAQVCDMVDKFLD